MSRTSADTAKLVSDRILDQVNGGAISVLGVATGSSPSAVYLELAAAESKLIRHLEVFALDEYVGLNHWNEASYHAVVEEQISKPLRLDPAKVHVPDGMAVDLDKAAGDYESQLNHAGGVDFQILGIGSNGHIAFNEPGSAFHSRTRAVDLSETTRKDNARFFKTLNDVPSQAITQGIGTVMDAATIVLIAIGEEKAKAVARALQGPINTDSPASALRNHPDVTFVLDRASGSALNRKQMPLASQKW